MKLGLNIHGNNVDRKALADLLAVTRPLLTLVLDSLEVAQDVKRALPEGAVVFREFEGDKALHTTYDARQWVRAHHHQSTGGIFLNLQNEPPFDRAVSTWTHEAMQEALLTKTPLCVGNWSVGKPGGVEDWRIMYDVVKLAGERPDLFMIGLHEYAGGVITSGLYGGYPDNAGVEPGKPGGMNLIQPDNWPVDTSKITCFHMGRFKFLRQFCAANGLKMPRVAITEWGFDDTSDIKPWLDRLRQTHPYLNIRSWRSCINQWREWYGALGWNAERALFEQLAWADRRIYADPAIVGMAIFCYGHSSKDWEPFDIANAPEFLALWRAATKEKVVYPVLPIITSQFSKAYVQVKLTGTKVPLYSPFPRADLDPVGYLVDGDEIGIEPTVKHDGFVVVKKNNIVAWANSSMFNVVAEKPSPPDAPKMTTLQISVTLPEQTTEAFVDAVSAFRSAILDMDDKKAVTSLKNACMAFFGLLEAIPETFREFSIKEIA